MRSSRAAVERPIVTEPDSTPNPDETSANEDTTATDAASDHSNEAADVADDYSLGSTSDPDGAERDVPAGEDYAGSGF